MTKEVIPNLTVNNFGWVTRVPRFMLFVLLPGMVVFSMVVGYLTTLILRPKSREEVIVVAAIAALIAGAVSFTTSLGWSPIMRQGIELGENDISLISDFMWMENEQQKELALRSLFLRYPGLAEVEPERRGQLLTGKIMRDQSLGVPHGMWEGIWIAICLAVVPLFLSLAFSGNLWQQGVRGISHWGRSTEFGIYVSLLLLLATKIFSTQTGAMPGWEVQLVTMLGVSCAIFLVLRNARWYVRLLGFVIVNLFFFANMFETSRVQQPHELARDAGTVKELEKVAGYYELKTRQRYSSFDEFKVAILCAYLGKDDDYRKHCDNLASGRENLHLPNLAERVAKALLLKPQLHSHLEQATELANSASELAESSGYKHWLYFARALSDLRQGNFDQALEFSQKCRDSFDLNSKNINNRHLATSTYAVDALAHLGKQDRELATEAIETAAKFRVTDFEHDPGWENRLVAEVLIQEYEQNIKRNE